MGCNCGKGRARALGTSPMTPMILGEDNESMPVRRVSIIASMGGVPSGATRYVRGTDVDTMIANGQLKLLGG